MQPMAISRLDLPHIKQTLDTFYRLLENPRHTLHDLAVPEGWHPSPPSATVATWPVVENWSPPNWWVRFCEAIHDPDDPDDQPLDPREPPPLTWVFRALSELLLAWLMPSGVEHPDIDDPVHADDIADSDLDESQKLALVAVCQALAPWGAFQALMERKGSRLRFRKLLEVAMEAIGGTVRSAGGPGTEPGPDLKPDLQGGTFARSSPQSLTAKTEEALASLPVSRRKAYGQYRDALRRNPDFGDEPTEEAVYNWVKEHWDPNDGKLPKFTTWSRYLREARAAVGEQKNKPRGGRPAGKSVVRRGDT
jgi:hypothetical protein